MWEASLDGLLHVLQPHLLLLSFLGIILGSVVAILPGIGSTALLAMALPFAMTMSPWAAIAFLVSIDAVSSTGSTITSVLTGIPGSSSSMATVVDGFPMTQKGEGARAIGAGLCVSGLGGIFGAVILTMSLPVLRPLVLALGAPEYFMLGLWGISMVGVLSGKVPVKGITAGILGVLIMTIGVDTKSGVPRYTFDQPYLWDGVKLMLVALGVYGIPETISMAVAGSSIAREQQPYGSGLMEGVKDGFRHWFLTLRTSFIGTWVGFVPGIGGPVAAWLAYGHAAQTSRNGKFGQGDIRGVIAPEAANNSVEGGSYITALAFGIPGNISTALILIAFMAVGMTPGPSMLEGQLNYVFAVIWTLVTANIVAAVLCLVLAKPISRMAFWPFELVVPVIVVLCFIGAFTANFAIQDLLLLLVFSVLGWFMRQLGWPRPPLLLGIVLGPVMEKYMWLSTATYGWVWLYRPWVILLFLLIVFTVVVIPLWNARKEKSAAGPAERPGQKMKITLRFQERSYFTLSLFLLILAAVIEALKWPLRTNILILFLGGIGVILSGVQLFKEVCPRTIAADQYSGMDVMVDESQKGAAGLRRICNFWCWLVGLFLGTWIFGFAVSMTLFALLFPIVHGSRWYWALFLGVLCLAMTYGLFELVIHAPWPEPLLWQLLGG